MVDLVGHFVALWGPNGTAAFELAVRQPLHGLTVRIVEADIVHSFLCTCKGDRLAVGGPGGLGGFYSCTLVRELDCLASLQCCDEYSLVLALNK